MFGWFKAKQADEEEANDVFFVFFQGDTFHVIISQNISTL